MKHSSTNIYMVRHGQTDWNLERRIQGHTDIPLNDTGRAEASALAQALTNIPFATCYSSDLKRAFETAQILITKHQLDIEIDLRLRERYFHDWEGKLFADFYHPKSEHGPLVESEDVLCDRVFDCFNDLVKRDNKGPILVVSHGGVMRNIVAHLLNIKHLRNEVSTTNTAMIQIGYENGQWILKESQGIRLPENSLVT